MREPKTFDLSGAVLAGRDVLIAGADFTTSVEVGDYIKVRNAAGDAVNGRVAEIVSDTHLVIG
jgi:hypothetical protein